MTENPPDAAARLGRAADVLARVRGQVGKVIVGLDSVIDQVLTALLADGHVLLEGPPGLGKTLLVRTLAASLDLDFRRLQCTPDLMPSDVTGAAVLVAGGPSPHLEFQPGPVFAQILLADEINRATPKTQAALLEAMEERTVTTAGATRPLPDPFVVLATQNPIEMEGTYPLPEAQLDRFLLKVHVPSPSVDELVEIVARTRSTQSPDVESVVDADELREAREVARSVTLAPALRQSVAELVAATRPGPDADPDITRLLRYGASPRGAIAVALAGRARAVLEARPHVARADLHAVALPALRHRLILSFEAEAEGRTADDILSPVIDRFLS